MNEVHIHSACLRSMLSHSIIDAKCVQVVVCYDQIRFQEEVNMVLAHELIHAYDHCRAKNVDWHNCEHHACSEVSFKHGIIRHYCKCMRAAFGLRSSCLLCQGCGYCRHAP